MLNHEELLKVYGGRGIVDAIEGETSVFRGGKLIGKLAPGESFVGNQNDESRIPLTDMYWTV